MSQGTQREALQLAVQLAYDLSSLREQIQRFLAMYPTLRGELENELERVDSLKAFWDGRVESLLSR